ncbi:MAG: DEAD/DEAH box helicase, partial [Promethearchaeota archaeon]
MFNIISHRIDYIPSKRFLLLLYTYFFNSLNNQFLSSVYYSRINPYSFQIFVALRAIFKKNLRIILGDEVGLGKTIEAGLILKELILKRNFKKILILVPPNIKDQWRLELEYKFNLYVESYDNINSKIRNLTAAEFKKLKIFLLTHFDIRYIEIKRLLLNIEWDLIIVDEAHHIRRRGVNQTSNTTQLWNLMYNFSIKKNTPKGIIFLTATPMQLDQTEIFNLIKVLDPNLFESYDLFQQYFEKSQLIKEFGLFIHKLISSHKDNEFLSEDEKFLFVEYISKNKERFNKLNFNTKCFFENVGNNNISISKLKVILDKIADSHILSQILIRNRKRDLLNTFSELKNRNIIDFKIEMSKGFKEIYNDLKLYVEIRAKDLEKKKIYGIKKGYIKAIYEQLITSSLSALKITLNKRIKTIEDNINEYDEYQELSTLHNNLIEYEIPQDIAISNEENITSDLQLIMHNELINNDLDDQTYEDFSQFNSIDEPTISEREFLQNLIKKIEKLGEYPQNDNKYIQLKNLIKEKLEAGLDSFIIIVKYLPTQNYLKNRLEADFKNLKFFILNGKKSKEERNKIIRKFEFEKGILLSTEVGGEGLNLQFCNFLINYDLPWNPMVLEQRIGRIDRIGQKNVVYIRNFIYKDTISEKKYSRLQYRYILSQQNIGELEPILKLNSHSSISVKNEMININEIFKDIILKKKSFDEELWNKIKLIFPKYNDEIIISYIYLFTHVIKNYFSIGKFNSESKEYNKILKVSLKNEDCFREFEPFRKKFKPTSRPVGSTSRFNKNHPYYFLISNLNIKSLSFDCDYPFLDHPLIYFMMTHVMNENSDEKIYYSTFKLVDNAIPPGYLLFYKVFNKKYSKLIPIYISYEGEYNESNEDKLRKYFLQKPSNIIFEKLDTIDLQAKIDEKRINKIIHVSKERLKSLISELKSIYDELSTKLNMDIEQNYDNQDFHYKLLMIAELKTAFEKLITLEIIPENFNFSQILLYQQKLDVTIKIDNITNMKEELFFEIFLNSEPLEFRFNEEWTYSILLKEKTIYKISIILPSTKQGLKNTINFRVRNAFFCYKFENRNLNLKPFIYKIFNNKNIQKNKFFINEDIYIKITSILPINEIEFFKIEIDPEEKIVSTKIKKSYDEINCKYYSLERKGNDYYFKIDQIESPGMYIIKVDGEELEPILILPNINITTYNNPFNNLIIQPLELCG